MIGTANLNGHDREIPAVAGRVHMMRRPWQSYESTGAIRLYRAGMSVTRIATILRRTATGVRSKLAREAVIRPDWFVNPGQFRPVRR